MNEAYNIDCLEYMRTLPDNAFDLCVADPPYGDGLHAEGGGGKGWFTKYNMKAEESLYNTEHRKQVRAVQARHGQGKNVRQPDGSWATPSGEPKRGGLKDRPEQEEPGQKNTAKKS